MLFQILNQKLKKEKGLSEKRAVWTEEDTKTFERLLRERKTVKDMERCLPHFTSRQIQSKIDSHKRKMKAEESRAGNTQKKMKQP